MNYTRQFSGVLKHLGNKKFRKHGGIENPILNRVENKKNYVMITFNERQMTLNDKQGCGGYSLAAVLVEMRKTEMETKAETEIIEVELTNQSRGRTIYNEIQKLQNESRSKDEIENQLLQGIVDLRQSLPSFICQAAIKYGVTDLEVHYSQNTLCEAFKTLISSGDIANGAITEEGKRIESKLGLKLYVDHGNTVDQIGQTLNHYYIVLVNDATHWVVVQQYAEDTYSIYDPANQLDKLSAVTKNFSGLFIKCWK